MKGDVYDLHIKMMKLLGVIVGIYFVVEILGKIIGTL